MTFIRHILVFVLAVTVLHPFAAMCLGAQCDMAMHGKAIAPVQSAHSCCAEESKPMACHEESGAPAQQPVRHHQHDDGPCLSCVNETLPAVRGSASLDVVVLPLAIFEPVIWSLPVLTAPVEVSPREAGPAPPTLVSLHTMLTC